MSKEQIGVLVMSYGTPEKKEQVEAYYTHIRRGNPPTPEQLAELTGRYEAIAGGVFPLRENTNRQVEALQETLNREHPEYDFRCYQGLKHASPFIEDGISQMAKDGIKRAIGIVLAPHYSVMSIGGYIQRAKAKSDELGIELTCVESYHMHSKLLTLLTERVQSALQRFDGEKVRMIFSAHSLPAKILEMGDPYQDQLLESSKAVAEAAGIEEWQFAWQSAGRTAVPWLGPDITDVLATLHHEEQVKNVLLCPIGFVSDHLEVLYDVDIECQAICKGLGMHLERTESLNDHPLYIETLSDCVYQLLKQ
ncbi:ferrochelatase [Paenibacillus albiflavus]|uniref:Coproporphyrin III ferrochelatase n=2 Tax=Paenibacillus albiflavus TaxID=2545760 RepID=A0A4R4ERG5_9BACL|nr:ferrochelatase [Paenibacillus albiflavus]TCZ81135.1 ferrochelatase [Paenibacillus albiflavus]